MAEENNNIDLREFGYTSQNLIDAPDTRDLAPAFEMPELNISPIEMPELNIAPVSRPSETPKQKEERAKAEIPSIVDRIRQTSGITFADESAFGAGLGSDLVEASKPKGMVLHRNDTPLGEIYDKLSDGTLIPRFENHVVGTDNEERLARQQGTWEKWGRGISKLVAKTGLYGVGGIVNPVYGAIEAIKTGNFDAVYNNDFMDWMNDLDTRLNYSLANYYTGEEKNRSFFGKMGTANFWANDVLGGMAFTTGALVSEAFWATVTGGASLAGAVARAGARAAGRSAVKGMTKTLGRRYFSDIKSTFNDYLRATTRGSKLASAVNNGRFIMTSAGWEASVEASHYMKEAELNFVNSYRSVHGKNPTAEELEEFRRTAASAGNTVFSANIGVVGLSNILQFGKYFGAGLDVAAGADRAVNRAFGLGARFNKTGALERVSASKLRKGLGVTYNIFKRPFTEGVWEEGTQGVISKAAESWINSRYDKTSMEKSLGVIDAISRGFAETYGTAEGRMEIGIGAIIGALTGVGGGRSTGFGGIMEYRNQSKLLDAQIEAYNAGSIPEAAVNLATRIAYTNQQIAATEEAGKAEIDNDAYASRQAYDKSLFTKFKYETEFGLLEDGAKNFTHVIENMSAREMAAEYGISEEDAENMKKNILRDYSDRLSEFKKVNEFAEAITSGVSTIGGVKKDFTDVIALNAFLGLRAGDRIREIASEVGELMQDDSYANSIYYYASLTSEGRQLEAEKYDLHNRLSELEEEIQKINTTIREEGSTEEYERRAREILRVRERLSEINEELPLYRGHLYMLDLQEAGRTLSIESAYDQMEKLDGYISALNKSRKETDKHRARLLDAVSEDLARSFADYNSVNEMLARLSDPRFMADEAKKVAKLFNTRGVSFTEEDAEGTIVRDQKLEDKITKDLAEGRITPSEAYTLRTFNRMDQAFIMPEENTDPISDETWETYEEMGLFHMGTRERQDIVDKVFEDEELSPRERKIYEQNKAYIDNLNEGRGDNVKKRVKKILDKLKNLKEQNFKTAKEANDAIINGAIASEKDETIKNQIRAAIDVRNKLKDDMEDGEEVDQDQILNLEIMIEEFGSTHGVDNLLDFVEQNRIIEQGLRASMPTGEVVDMTDLVDHMAPPETTHGGARFDNAQNIEMLTAKKDKSGTNMVVSGMKMQTFVDMLTRKMGAQEIKKTEGEKGTILNIGGEDIHLYPSTHSAVKIPMADIQKIQDISIERGEGLIFTLQPALAGANSREVLWLNQDRTLEIIPTNVTYGKKGRDIINDQEVLKVRNGDRIIARIDFEDDYNRSLWRRYKTAKEKFEKAKSDYEASDKSNDGLRIEMEQTEKAFQGARNSIKNNLVIKLIDNERGEGAFVSVVKSIPSSAATEVYAEMDAIRERAAQMFLSNAETRENGHMDVGTYRVGRLLPGRPNLDMRLGEDGVTVEVTHHPITALEAEKISGVGYMLNGTVYAKGKKFTKETKEFKTHPFMSLVSRNAKNPGDKYYNQKMPFVVIDHPNGESYAYPVQVNQVEDHMKKVLMDDLELYQTEEYRGMIDRTAIMDWNTYALSYGVNPKYFIRLSGSYVQIAGDMQRMLEELRALPNTIDVEEWITGKRSPRQIAVEDARINLPLSSDFFHAQKIVMDFSTGKKAASSAAIDDELLAKPDDDMPFGEDSSTTKLLDAPC